MKLMRRQKITRNLHKRKIKMITAIKRKKKMVQMKRTNPDLQMEMMDAVV